MYQSYSEMFDGLLKDLKKNIKRVEENTSDLQKQGVVGSIKKFNYEVEQLMFGIEIDHVAKKEQEAKTQEVKQEEVVN